MKVLGVVPQKDCVLWVMLNYDGSETPTCVDYGETKLGDDNRAASLDRLHADFVDFVKHNQIKEVVCKQVDQFVLTQGRRGGQQAKITMAWFEAAEVRGVILAACRRAGANAVDMAKSTASRRIGNRKFDDYIEDSSLWDRVAPDMPKKYREAGCMALIACR